MTVPTSFVTVPQNSEERRAFLQARVALFGKVLAITSIVFLAASASSYFLLAPEPSLATRLDRDRYDLAAIALLLALWGITSRVGAIPRLGLECIEAGATVLVCLFYATVVAGSDEPIYILIPVLFAVAVLMARAVFIPTTPRRTLLVSSFGVIPAVVVAWIMASRSGAQTSIPSAVGPTIYVACWAGMAVALSTITSRIIYGLEEKVREARQLGQYTLDERIGEGGMGLVYRARHAMLRRPTAIKVLPPDKMGAQNLARFEREVQLTSQLTHPNTVAIYDYGRTPEGLFYYAMEYLEGFTLGEIVAAVGPLPAGRVAWIMRQVAGSLEEAHGVGLVHRDIKPDNIIVCTRGGHRDVAKVLDFGLVKDFRSSDPKLSSVETMVGTPLYMSPEAFRAPDSVSVASDVYAMGAVAYYLVAGKHLFRARTFAEIAAMHLAQEPEPPSRTAPLPPALETLILSCLAKDPALRPASAGELERAFADLLATSPWTQADAEDWWRTHGGALAKRRRDRSVNTPSMAVASTFSVSPR